VFSDGCPAQFKCSRAMFFVARYASLTNGCKMLWQYFSSGHGKGELLMSSFSLPQIGNTEVGISDHVITAASYASVSIRLV
jgi:hypothetical protein